MEIAEPLIRLWDARIQKLVTNREFQHPLAKRLISIELKAIRQCKKDLKNQVKSNKGKENGNTTR